MVAIDKRWVINRQGKDFVLYAGLLETAHANGLQSVKTELLRLEPALCVVQATVEMADGRVFAGIGDATPENVGRNIAPHFIRMAETRAKARALRDALSIGAASIEELGGDDDDAPAYQPKPDRQPTPLRVPPAVQAQIPGESPLREEARAVYARMKRINPATTVVLPADDADDATWNLFIDEYAAKVQAAERRGQTASRTAR